MNRIEKSQSGFTLVEIMIVVGIIAILAGMFLVGAAKFRLSANAARVKSDVQKIEALQELYATRKNGVYATTKEELEAEVGTLPTISESIAKYEIRDSNSCARIDDKDLQQMFSNAGESNYSGGFYCLKR